MGQYSKLSHKNVDSTIFSVSSLDGNLYTEGIDFDLFDTDGQIYVREGGSMTEGQTIVVSYRYYPIRNSEKLAAEEGNPVFDGMIITVQNDELELDNALISWNEYSPNNWTWWVKPFNNLPNNMHPADYEIRWFSSLVSSNFRPGHEHIKANFEIWETTRGFPEKQLPFVILETITTDSLWNPGERIIILQDSAISSASWELTFYEPSAGTGNVPPVEGDIFSIYTNRPFADDIFSFSTTASTESNQVEKENMDNIYVVPNPYVVSSNIESLDLQNPRDRGPRRVYFANLPASCTIKIYTMAGDLVRTLKHEGSIENGIETWDLTTSDNFPGSFGIYIFHVESENGNESVGRFALIK